ncbi:hypothetical protein MRB53_002096 [Persea americana]|uniref:Uncharacterized protein n=1 Tax=Persea americana TaxID=3435 RepID=A0ACC2MTV6_PERAE|nr:hypothetical protein MRB53_002096 [Persea americana]
MSSGQNPKNVQRPYPLGFVANQSTGPLWPATVAGQWPVQVLRTAAKLLVQRPTAVHSRCKRPQENTHKKQASTVQSTERTKKKQSTTLQTAEYQGCNTEQGSTTLLSSETLNFTAD